MAHIREPSRRNGSGSCSRIIFQIWMLYAGHSFIHLQILASLLIFECCAWFHLCFSLHSSPFTCTRCQSSPTHLLHLPHHQTFSTHHQLLPVLQLWSQPQPCLVAALTNALDILISKRPVDLVLPHQARATQVMFSPKPNTTSANSSTHIEVSFTSTSLRTQSLTPDRCQRRTGRDRIPRLPEVHAGSQRGHGERTIRHPT